MFTYRYVLLAAVLFLASACHESPTALEGTVLGRFGGDNILLTAERTRVAAIVGCNTLLSDKPLIPNEDGQFLLSAAWRDHGIAAAAVLRGMLNGPTMTLEVVSITPDTIITQHFTAVRDMPGGSSIYCPLAD